jgi:hypothetical protein
LVREKSKLQNIYIVRQLIKKFKSHKTVFFTSKYIWM